MIKLSIIIPYYNAKPYTDELLSCLAPQITDECEVLLVDDGSKEPYTTEYNWVKIYRKENGGASSARNMGLDNAKGKYIAFIDADDKVADNYVSTIINKIDIEKFDYCYLSWDSFGGWDVTVKLNSVDDEFPSWNLCLWNRIIKRSVIGRVRLNTKKAIAEDAEFIRKVPTKDKKKSFISEILYHYRSNTPNSLTKEFANGNLNMNRIVYHYSHITSDMGWLVQEVREKDKEAEVIIMTNNNELPELENYAMILNPPSKVKGTEFYGEPTHLYEHINKPIIADTVIYTEKTFAAGGIESWIYNFSKIMKDTRDILVLYDFIDKNQLKRLEQIVQCEKNSNNKKIICKNIIINRITDDVPKNVKYEKKIQMVHCEKLKSDWHIPKDYDVLVPVSEVVYNSFEEEIDGRHCQIINNMTTDRDPKRVLYLISATRNTFEKGVDKIIKFARRLNEKNIPFIWTVFCDSKPSTNVSGLVFMDTTLDIRNYIARSDYLLQFSSNEAFCYSIVEAMQDSVPVVTTPLPVLKDIGFRNEETGFIVDFDLSNMDEIIDKMYSSTLVFKYQYDNQKIKDEWINILGETHPKNNYIYTPSQMVEILITEKYKDIDLNRIVRVGEKIEVTKDRANQIINAGFAKLID